MPLVRISMNPGRTAEQRRAIGNGIHDALVEAIGIPADDRFQVLSEEPADGLVYDPGYGGVARTDGVVFIQIYLRRGRTPDMKRALYRAAARNLSQVGVRPQDVFIALSENELVDWSFGDGIAQYAPE